MANYVSLGNLQLYDEKIKELIGANDDAILQSSKDYADSLASNYATATQGAIAEANADAIEELQEGLDSVEDKYLNPDANNKYNVEDNIIELYLNDAKYEQVFYNRELGSITLTSTAKYSEYSVVDGEGNFISEEDFQAKIAEGDAYGHDMGGFEDCYPDLKVVYISNGDGTYTEHQATSASRTPYDIYNLIYFDKKEVFIKAEATKVKVKMDELDEKMASMTATKEDIEKLFK